MATEVLAAAGGALMSAAIDALFEKLRSSELSKFISKAKLVAERKKWEIYLERIDALLIDAEGKQTENRSVKLWLDELRDLAYDIEDVLDEFSAEALKRRLTKKNSHVHSIIAGLGPASFSFKWKMVSKMKYITAKLQDIATREQTLNLTRIKRGRPNKSKERPPTSSLVESHICGREDDKKALVRMLLSDEGSSNPFSVIHILGMGGIGKTTLAQLVYNDYNVKDYFGLKVWVCVSENFDVEMLTRTILQTITGETHKHLPFNSVQENLKKKLSQEKFLLILDDVWEEDYMKWADLCKPFSAGAVGSKIVITSRKKNVASMAVNAPTLDVKGLLDDECLSLLAIHALSAENFDSYLNLKDIALEMVKRCKGLPLAAKVLGGLLRNKQSPEDWKKVLSSETWNLRETSNATPLAVLKLSYDDLPSHLKRCFVYCAIFPKDYEFYRDELVLLWMAEGFLPLRMEDSGIGYFDDLVSRSLFQSSNKYGRQGYVMHDLIHDLAQSMAGEFFYNYDQKINSNGEQSDSKLKKVRHASIQFPEDGDLHVLTPKNSLRTALCFPIFEHYVYQDGNAYTEQFYNLVIGSECLRVLSLTSPRIRSLPDSIGDLKLLRHLNLSYTAIECLPDSVSSLFNLLTLLLYSCERLKKLPDKIGYLVNLLHLDISNTPQLQEFPSSIGMLTNLQTLSKFVVNESRGTTIAVLKKLNNLRGILSIEALHNMINMQDATSANLKEKQYLEELVFICNGHHGGLESLKPPHQNLKRLTIDSYGGSKFPSWVSDPSFSKLVSLNLTSCEEIKFLPALHNLGYLCKLKINRCSSLVSFASVGCPSLLEDLEIFECASLKDFGTNFKLPTSLKNFIIKDCRNLLSLPDGLMVLDNNTNLCQSHLKVLRISGCEQLTSFPLGKLPASLKILDIWGCSRLVSFAPVGFPSHLEDLQISNCASLKYFQTDFKLTTSLKTFEIEDCPSLLSLPDGLMMSDDNTDPCQSHLEDLSIIGCKQLTSFPPGKLPATLKTLGIMGCSSLVSFAPVGCPSLLEDLQISNCASLKYFGTDFKLATSLKTFEIEDCPSLLSLPDGLMTSNNNTNSCQSHLEVLTIIGCEQLTYFPLGKLPATLKALQIMGCSSLVSFAPVGCLSLLEDLQISNCASLKYFNIDFKLATMKTFKIEDCPSLLSLPDRLMMSDDNTNPFQSHLEDLSIIGCEQLISFPPGKLPATLKTLGIIGCSSLVSFAPVGCPSLLEDLQISNCASLKYFGTDFKLATLKTFKIEDCPSLLSLPNGLMTLDDNTNPWQSHLEVLSIIGCNQLTSFPPGKLPATLKTLRTGGCKQMKNPILGDMLYNIKALESIEIWKDDEIRVFPSIIGLQSLRSLRISGCSALESFPEMELPALGCLTIEECRNLSSLPSQMDTHLRSLETLSVSSCPRLESLTQGGGGLPKGLTLLYIGHCENLRQPMAEWGLHMLSYLWFLHLKGKCSAFSNVVSFLKENRCLLPTSLDLLDIEDMNLESLGLGLRKLTCLRRLYISKCPKLQYLSKEALPSSLIEVSIWDCPLLKEHYLKNKGEYPLFIYFA